MSLPSSWRDLLKAFISTTHERERIAIEVGVNQVTLNRWANGESQPRSQNARQLLRAIPKPQRDLFAALLHQEYGNFSEPVETQLFADEIELAFIRQVHELRATTPAPLLFWTLCRKVLQNAVRRLDSQEIGLAISVAQCTPPPTHDNIVHSLREIMTLGTSLWSDDQEQQFMFLGFETLAGYVVSKCQPRDIDDLQNQTTLLPISSVRGETSAAASPIMYTNRVAGCLVVSSTQPRYFSSATRLRLIADYTRLIALAFTPEQFYAPEQIQLHTIPPYYIQQRQLATLQQRIVTLMKESFNQPHPLSRNQAELLAWQQIEKELLRENYQVN